MIDLSVIAPCFNEEDNLPLLVARLLKVCERRGITAEIVLVDDGSTDGTAGVVDDLARRHPQVVGMHHGRNRGLAAGWDTGLAASRGAYVCFIDADLQNPPEEVWRLYREITQSHADMVQGVRSPIGRLKDERYITSRALNVLLNLVFGMSSADNKSGFVIALRETMVDVLRRRFRYRHFHVFIAVSAHAKGFTIREIETLFQNRHAGASFIKRWPVKLVTSVCVDVARAFAEFRVLPRRTGVLESFLETSTSPRLRSREPRWRRVIHEARSLTLRRDWLGTPRVRRLSDSLAKIQGLAAAEIRQLQERRLRRLCRHAYWRVPYYRERFAELGIRPEQIRTLDDLRRLPTLSWFDVTENMHFDLFADNHRKREMKKVTGSGPTGAAFDLYVDQRQLEMSRANLLRAFGWYGWRFGDRHVTLRLDGRNLSPQRFSQWLGIKGRVLLEGSSRSLSDVAECLSEDDGGALSSDVTISAIDMLTDDVRRRLERFVGRSVFDAYEIPGLGGVAFECSAHSGYHVPAESYIVEIMNGDEAAPPGEYGEVVITDLNGFSVPLIRYRTGDLAFIDQSTCRCGLSLPRLVAIQQHPRVMQEPAAARLAAIDVTLTQPVRVADRREPANAGDGRVRRGITR